LKLYRKYELLSKTEFVSESQWCIRDQCTNANYCTDITEAKFLVAHNGPAAVRVYQHVLSQSLMYCCCELFKI